jgi:hypothetical protein
MTSWQRELLIEYTRSNYNRMARKYGMASSKMKNEIKIAIAAALEDTKDLW